MTDTRLSPELLERIGRAAYKRELERIKLLGLSKVMYDWNELGKSAQEWFMHSCDFAIEAGRLVPAPHQNDGDWLFAHYINNYHCSPIKTCEGCRPVVERLNARIKQAPQVSPQVRQAEIAASPLQKNASKDVTEGQTSAETPSIQSADLEARCELCGELMPKGEDMFNYHGYSGPCPAPQVPNPTDGAKAEK